VLRRLTSAVALLALATAPVVARTRLFCRYSGTEITDCLEQRIPSTSVIQVEGCCDRQVTRTLGAARIAQQQEVTPPVLNALPAIPSFDVPDRRPPAQGMRTAAEPTRPPVFLITRALLI
jgi:hypothetical protein